MRCRKQGLVKGKVLIVGAGGAARAVGYALAENVQEIFF